MRSAPTHPDRRAPDRPALAAIARTQGGLFTTAQAATAGYSRALLAHHRRTGQFEHVRRGVYRFAEFPRDPQEELAALWLAAGGVGTYSHESALELHGLSDVLTTRHHLTLPPSWRRRVIPDGIEVAYADLPDADRTWVGLVPVTSVPRTLRDCAAAGVLRQQVEQALRESLGRGLVTASEVRKVRRDLAR